MNILNPSVSITKLDKPYEIWILDNFLLPEVPEKINSEWPDENDAIWFKGIPHVEGEKNILEQGMFAISSPEKTPLFTGEVLHFFHTNEFTKFLENLTGREGLLSDSSWRWSGMRNMTSGSHQLIHSDARRHPGNGKRKELTALYYLNQDYNKDTDAGFLEIWNDEMTECVHKIEPKYNRLVVFACSDTSYHGVPVVNKQRKMLTFSVLKEGVSTNRTKALFVARPCDANEITDLGLKRSTIPDIKY